jgi:hypothetical protein
VLGFVAQAVKICVDATLQQTVLDGFRGRVFSVYDALFNVSYVVALLVGAAVLPASGRSPGLLVAVAAGYLLTAALCGAEWFRPRDRDGSTPVRRRGDASPLHRSRARP